MKFLLFILFLSFPLVDALAQRVGMDSRNGERYVMPHFGSFSEPTPFNEYFGEHSDVMNMVSEQAEANRPRDGFDFKYQKLRVNSCALASENLITDLKGGILPDGYKVRQIGELGALSNFMNTVTEEGDFAIKWWANGVLDSKEFDILDPPSYSHTLSVVEAPDGRYFTVDNWMGGVKMQEVYPIDSDGVFFSTNPNETNVYNAKYRVQRNKFGLCAYPDDCPEDEPNRPNQDERDPEDVNSPTPSVSEPAEVEVLTSADPNDKLGMRGAGEGRYIIPGLQMDYMIRFENMPDASAPAQEVLIRDTLDTRAFDLSTFELRDITFSDTRVPVPAGLTSYFTSVPVLDDQFELLIDANLVMETGIVTWKFTTYDPEINDLPFDPLDGFLPPNQEAPEGEGSVSFTVKAKDHLPNNFLISNEARIYFDLNEPIDTPPWANTIDTEAPTSSVMDISEASDSRLIELQWDGTDYGSGIKHYDIYMSVNDGPFMLWHHRTTDTSGRYVGYVDSTYSFFSIAHDRVGHTEPMKTVADVTTRITVSLDDEFSDLPVHYELFQNYPNPFNPSTTIPFALPEPADVTITLYDIMGRRVATLLNDTRPAGWHNVTWDASSLASGAYFYRIRTDSFTSVKKLTLIK